MRAFIGLGFVFMSAALAACVTQGSATPPSGAQTAAGGPTENWLIENFDSPSGLSGPFQTTFDTNGLGTQMNPQPFALDSSGAPSSPKASARIWGTLGSNKAPWS